MSVMGEHGGDAGAVAADLGIERSALIDLSMSMNPVAPDVRPVLADLLDTIGDYPDPVGATESLARAIGVDRARLVITNGGAEAIALVASTMEAGHVVEPDFSLYRRHLARVDDDAPRWRSNPSNPVGRLAGDDETAAVWDEAFWPIATGTWTNDRLDDEFVWRLGSLTKLWACPGLRLGYALAPDDRSAELVRARQPRWSVSSMALGAVVPMLERTDLTSWATEIRTLRSAFGDAVRDLGFRVADTDVNWILVEDEMRLRDRLIPHGVLVRDCTSFGLPTTARVAVPRKEQFDRVVTAFARVAQARS